MNIGAYAIVLAATFFGLPTLVAGLASMPFSMIQGKLWPGATSIGFYFVAGVNALMWLGIAALWGVVLGGPMPLLLFAGVFLVYGLTARDPHLTPAGFTLAGAEQWGIVAAAVAHVFIAGIRWF